MARTRLLTALLAGTTLAGPVLVAPGLLMAVLPGPVLAVELPRGGTVVHGGVAIGEAAGGRLVVNQSTATAIVNWQGFSIGQGGRVDFNQPSANAAILNRVTGATPSSIAGELTANGRVYLVNPNGIAITSTGVVRAGAFVASSLDISDDDFKAGRRVFRGSGSSAAVTNAGTIDIARGGYAALLGGQVENSGTISVPLGRVGLGAGEQATLDLSGDGFLQVAVPSKGAGSDAALIRQSGRIAAAGGRVELQAATARDAARNAINLSGVVEARSVGGRSGAIVLGGGEGGRVLVTGRLDASGTRARRSERAATARGGSITVTGDAIELKGARLDADGAAGGGRVRVGGDYQGGGTLQRARTTTVDAATTISADATRTGDGGSVVVWSDQMTAFAGRITARGGAAGGNGGDAEVSGKALLDYTGFADLAAPRGRFGTLLLDPYNVVISNGPDSGGFTASGNDSVVNAGTLSTALNAANVTVTTGGAGSPGTQAGDVTVLANVGWTAPTSLTLSAFRDVTLAGGTIAVPAGGALNLRSDNGGTGIGTVRFAGSGVTAAPGSNVSIYYNPADNPAGSGVNGTSYTAPTAYAVAGGGTLAAYMLVNTAADLQNMRNNLGGFFAQGRTIDASAAAGFNAGAGFQPVGGTDTPFTGRFNGLDQTIANLRIVTAAGADAAGLFGAATGAILANVNLSNVSVQGGAFNTGGLVGLANDTSIGNVSVAGLVQGQNSTGGIAGGMNGGLIEGGRNAATVVGTDNTGGLVGGTDGTTIRRSTSTGAVSGGDQVGGLVGIALSTTITQSSASGDVTGSDLVGGLVGGIGGEGNSGALATVSQSFATGAVTSAARGGGLVGLASNNATISDSYATGPVSGGTAAGGLIGEINSVPANSVAPVIVTSSYATGLVVGAGSRGGLVGNVQGTLQSVTNSYWDVLTSGLTTSAGGYGTGLTTAGLQGALPPGFAPGIWGTQPGAYPYLSWRFPNGVLAVSGFARGPGDNGAPLAGEPLRVATGGTASSRIVSGANGYYYVARDPLTGTGPQGATVFFDGASRGPDTLALSPYGTTAFTGPANRGSATVDAPTGRGTIANLDPRAGRIIVTTAQPTASGLAALLSSAGDSNVNPNIPYSTAAGPIGFRFGLPTFIESTGTGMTIDRSILAGGDLRIAGTNSGSGGLNAAGPITIAPGQSVQSQFGDVTIATFQFTNQAGAAAVQAGGRTLIYSQDYDADQRGGLGGGLIYGRTFAGSPPGSIGEAGNQFIYARAAPTNPPAPPAPSGNAPAPPAPIPPGTTPIPAAPVIDPLTIALSLPTLVRQLPPTFIPVSDPADTIEFAQLPGLGRTRGQPGLGPPILGQDQRNGLAGDETLAYLEEAGRLLDAETARCEEGGVKRRVAQYNGCVADALAAYATRIETRIAQLPPALRDIPIGDLPRSLRARVAGRPTLRSVPEVIRAAARQVRAARTVRQARAVVRAAVAVVRKAITLIRADEPVFAARQTRHGNAIAGALQRVETRLARAEGL